MVATASARPGAAGPAAPTASADRAPAPRHFTAAELRAYDGVCDRRIYIAFRGRVYDVSSRRDLYSAEDGGGYAALAGRDATRALAKMSLKAEDVGRCDVEDLLASPLGELHEKAIRDWTARFGRLYECMGTLDSAPDAAVFAPAPRPVEAAAAAAADAARAETLSAPAPPAPLRAPGEPELVCRKPRMYRVRNFLTPQECKQLRQMATGPTAMIFSEAKIREGLRASDERWSPSERALLTAVETRLGWLTGSPPHPDEVDLVGTLTPPSAEGSARCHLGLHVDTNGGRAWRYVTAICYLSTVAAGGRTCFPLARTAEEEDGEPPSDEQLELLEASQRLLDGGVDHTDRVLEQGMRPDLRGEAEALVAAASAGSGVNMPAELGTVVLFWTRRNDGSIDPHSWHGGEAVGLGSTKWTLQKFKEVPAAVRAKPEDLAGFVADTRRKIMK